MPSTHRSLVRPPLPPGPMRAPRDLSTFAPVSASLEGAAIDAIAGLDGPLSFELKAAAGGVHVVRIHRRDDGAQLYCSVLFEEEHEFLEWLDADPVRYTHPLVFQQARRCFAQLMTSGGRRDTVGG